MNPKVLQVSTVDLEPVTFSLRREPVPDLFVVAATYSRSRAFERFNYASVPPEVRHAIETEKVTALQMVAMPGSRLMRRAIPGSPDWLVQGVRTEAGQVIAAAPPVAVSARRWLLGIGSLVGMAGLFALAARMPWLGAAACVVSTHALT